MVRRWQFARRRKRSLPVKKRNSRGLSTTKFGNRFAAISPKIAARESARFSTSGLRNSRESNLPGSSPSTIMTIGHERIQLRLEDRRGLSENHKVTIRQSETNGWM